MNVENELIPTSPERIAELTSAGPAGPVFMVNLLKFKDRAEYEDGRKTALSGAEAYSLYFEGVRALLPTHDAEVVFEGDVGFLAIGQVENLWDSVVIIRYPSRGELTRMGMSSQYQEHFVHRLAGLEGQLNIETTTPPG